jgi:pimeloyl-ACP methyl ester carboxylesterase
MNTDPISYAINRAYQFVEEQQRALDEGRISEAQWFENNERFMTENYVTAGNPRAQSGHGGDEARYRYTRMMVLEAIHRDGAFLDVGCANGYLMQSLHHWLQGSGLSVAFYGLDFSPELLALARTRLPQWHDRFFLGNALYWTPETPYDFVCIAELGYVPRDRQGGLFEHLFKDYVKPGGRLILGPSSELRDQREMEAQVCAWGYLPTGYCEKSHQSQPSLCRRLFWFDKPSAKVHQIMVPAISCPTLILTADPDKGGIVTPEVADEVCAANPNFRVAHIPGVGHHVRFGDQATYMRAVWAFLEEIR